MDKESINKVCTCLSEVFNINEKIMFRSLNEFLDGESGHKLNISHLSELAEHQIEKIKNILIKENKYNDEQLSAYIVIWSTIKLN
ncbi:hypothetical protein [Paenibacillus chitinolyticus]|uniref:hypothetical protein n=1 Tax=Paenibacillus chitinolyticus TaxID=79263 RepID=UPI00366B684A